MAVGILLSAFGTVTTRTPASQETCACPAAGTCNCNGINPATASSNYTINSLGVFLLIIGLLLLVAHTLGVDLF